MATTTDPAAVAAAGAGRIRLIKLVHIGKSRLGLSDDDYRALLSGATGKSSSSLMTVTELEAVLASMRTAGFIPEAPSKKRLAVLPENVGGCTGRQVYYMKGLWELASREKSEESLRFLIKRLAGVDDIRFIPRAKGSSVIQALRDIARKAGFDPDKPPRRESV